MTRPQAVAIAILALNLALALLFPPYDYVSLRHGNIPTFDGFHFVFGQHANLVLNRNFLILEAVVVLINACIAWLLLGRAAARPGGGINRVQRGVLWVVAGNLVLMLLFPPFENYTAITKATLPTFDGFYFVFGDNATRQLVTPLLYIEVALALINGALAWLLFKNRGADDLTPEQLRALAVSLRDGQKR